VLELACQRNWHRVFKCNPFIWMIGLAIIVGLLVVYWNPSSNLLG